MKKIIVILILAGISACMMPISNSQTTVTGTFTPLSSGVSIACNNTAPNFGNINLNSNKAITGFNLTNTGNVNCSVTMTAGEGAGTWTMIAGTSSPAATNRYCVNMNPALAGYVDVYTIKTVIADLHPSGTKWMHFDLKVYTSQFTSEGTPAQQTFYANLTAAAIS